MSWMSEGALEFGAQSILDSLEADDLTEELSLVVGEGWECHNGANLLIAWRQSYFGDQSSFPDITTDEYYINGRGIPDHDLDNSDDDQKEVLLRRGLAFACAALQRSQRDLPFATMVGHVSVTPTDYDPTISTGHVTFHTDRADFSPTDFLGAAADAIVILTASDIPSYLDHQKSR